MIDKVHDFAITNYSTLKNGLKRASENPDDMDGWKFFAEFIAIRFVYGGKKNRQLTKDEIKKLAPKLKDSFIYLEAQYKKLS